MNFKIIVVGKIKERYLKQGIEEYLKRLRAYGKVEICEVKEESFNEPLSAKNIIEIMDKEGERILTQIPNRYYTIVLDRLGNQICSRQLAANFKKQALYGQGNLAFVIGGSLGLATSVTKKADLILSFSKLTFPHQLMRLILVEQIYRAMTIIRNEKYHK